MKDQEAQMKMIQTLIFNLWCKHLNVWIETAHQNILLPTLPGIALYNGSSHQDCLCLLEEISGPWRMVQFAFLVSKSLGTKMGENVMDKIQQFTSQEHTSGYLGLFPYPSLIRTDHFKEI